MTDFDVIDDETKPLKEELRGFVKPARRASWLAVIWIALEVIQKLFETVFYILTMSIFTGGLIWIAWTIYTEVWQ